MRNLRHSTFDIRHWAICLLLGSSLHAGVMDFKTLGDAKAAYEKGDYAKASELYGSVLQKNDAARYNYADALYRQKKYQEAAEVFSRIKEPSLRHKALHNLGNSYANMGKTDEAIKAYEEALKLEEDKDTRYNLELLKKQKEQQQKKQNKNRKNDRNKKDDKQNKQDKQNQKNNDKNKDRKNGKNKQNRDQKQNDRKDKQDKQNQNGKQDQKQKQNEGKNKKSQNEKEKQKQKEQQKSAAQKQKEKEKKEREKAQAKAAMAQPISDMEERKYNKMLDRRGIKTLMIPLQSKGKPHENETTPW